MYVYTYAVHKLHFSRPYSSCVIMMPKHPVAIRILRMVWTIVWRARGCKCEHHQQFYFLSLQAGLAWRPMLNGVVESGGRFSGNTIEPYPAASLQ